MDPAIIIAAIAAIGAAWSTWQTNRKETKTARVAADSETFKVTGEVTVRREQLLTEGIEQHFNRLERQLDEAQERHDKLVEQLDKAEGRIDSLTRRVQQLEDERHEMLAWMAENGLAWPRPGEQG